MNNTLQLRLTNTKCVETTFVLEPWGDFWPMPAGATYEVILDIAGEKTNQLPEIVYGENSITVFVGVGGDVRVLCNGQDVREQMGEALPLQKAA